MPAFDEQVLQLLNRHRPESFLRQGRQLQELFAQAKATAVWMYAPGLIDPAARTLDHAHIGHLTGMPVAPLDEPVPDRLVPTEAAQRMAPNAEPFGSGKTDLASQWRILPGPNTVPLATYAHQPDAAAMARTGRDGFVSVHCAGLDLSTGLLRALAREADVWIYCDQGDAVTADRHTLMIHAASTGEKTVRFPRAVTITDALTGAPLGAGHVLKLPMQHTETRLLRLE